MKMKTNKVRDDLMDLLFDAESMRFERARLQEDPMLLDQVPGCTWRKYYRHRLKAAASYAAMNWNGDLVEIGCWNGGTTQFLLQVAEVLNRRVIAVDPWEVTAKVDREKFYQTFLRLTAPWRDRLEVRRVRSQSEEAICRLRDADLCFAYVDGEHTYEALSTDLDTVAHASIIAVDDIYYRFDHPHTFECREAFWDHARKTGREMLWYPNCTEGYLLPRGTGPQWSMR